MVRIEGVTREPRNEMIARVSQAIREAGGSILDFRFFSNLMLFISAEVDANAVPTLREKLISTGLNLDTRSMFPEEPAAEAPRRESVPFHLVVTFIHDEPDLRIAVPAIPG